MKEIKRIRVYVQEYANCRGKMRWVNAISMNTHEEAIEKMKALNEMQYKFFVEDKGLTPEQAKARITPRRILDNNGWTYTAK